MGLIDLPSVSSLDLSTIPSENSHKEKWQLKNCMWTLFWPHSFTRANGKKQPMLSITWDKHTISDVHTATELFVTEDIWRSNCHWWRSYRHRLLIAGSLINAIQFRFFIESVFGSVQVGQKHLSASQDTQTPDDNNGDNSRQYWCDYNHADLEMEKDDDES